LSKIHMVQNALEAVIGVDIWESPLNFKKGNDAQLTRGGGNIELVGHGIIPNGNDIERKWSIVYLLVGG
jgi:hypothetical protein